MVTTSLLRHNTMTRFSIHGSDVSMSEFHFHYDYEYDITTQTVTW